MWVWRNKSHKYKYCLRLREYGLEFDLEYRTYAIPLCHESIAVYRTKKGLQIAKKKASFAPPPFSRETEA